MPGPAADGDAIQRPKLPEFPVSSFLGREARSRPPVKQHLADRDTRLLTLTGPGGGRESTARVGRR